MLSGMTGFARREGALEAWTWSVEARSVNGRNLDVRFKGPPGFEGLDRLCREAAQKTFQRGQVTVGLQAKRAESFAQARVNVEILERFAALSAGLVEAGKAVMPRADGLLGLRGVIEIGEEEDDPAVKTKIETAMAKTLQEAIEALHASRLAEGAALVPVLAGLIDKIEGLIGLAEGHAGQQPMALKERFQRRMAELTDVAISDDRIALEAAVLASKADVREELDRLAAHVEAARTLLADRAPSGRRLDFLIQEFMREANTLCSKSASGALTTVGLELKATIDQFREQVQNVE